MFQVRICHAFFRRIKMGHRIRGCIVLDKKFFSTFPAIKNISSFFDATKIGHSAIANYLGHVF